MNAPTSPACTRAKVRPSALCVFADDEPVGVAAVVGSASSPPQATAPPTRTSPNGFHTLTSGNTLSMTTRTGSTTTVARVVAVVADVMAFIIGLWILMYLLDANRANDLVEFVRETARWLAGWSHDLFTFDKEWARVVAGYGLAAVVYLFIGHAAAGALRRR